jgi:hypothetical protein
MKQSFSAYPAGLSGVALLLFRASLALFMTTALPMKFTSHFWPAVIIDIIAIAIAAGFYTRFFSILCAGAGMVAALNVTCTAPILLAAHILDALALAMIGPGAFSIDARLFGRSVINLPR